MEVKGSLHRCDTVGKKDFELQYVVLKVFDALLRVTYRCIDVIERPQNLVVRCHDGNGIESRQRILKENAVQNW